MCLQSIIRHVLLPLSTLSVDGQSVRSVEQRSRQDLHLSFGMSSMLFYFRTASVADITTTVTNVNRFAV